MRNRKQRKSQCLWCATRQVDNEKNIKFLCCPVYAGQYFMQPISVHDIPTVLILQDIFADGHLCNSLCMQLSLVQVPLLYDTSFHNTFRVLKCPRIPPLLHYPYSALLWTCSVSSLRLPAFDEMHERYIGILYHCERLDEPPDCPILPD